MIQENIKIKVIGLGSGGMRIINCKNNRRDDVDYIFIDSDIKELEKYPSETTIQIGRVILNGNSAEDNIELGKNAAESSVNELKNILEETDMLFLVVGAGGGVGSGAAPVISKIAKDMGILTISIVTLPFMFEGKQRRRNSSYAIEELKKNSDSTLLFENDKLFSLDVPLSTVKESFDKINELIGLKIKSITDMLFLPGTILLDINDIRSIVRSSGKGALYIGVGQGEERIYNAFDNALNDPLAGEPLHGAKKILLNILSNGSLEVQEANVIKEKIRDTAGTGLEDMRVGIVNDDNLTGEEVKIVVFANTFVRKLSTKFMNNDANNKEKNNEEINEKSDTKGIKIPDWVKG